MRKTFFTAALAICAVLSAHSQSTPWGYSGKLAPERWAKLDGSYLTCANGKEQSPIDIRGAKPTALAPLEFHYRSDQIKLNNDGHTILAQITPGSFLTVAGQRYDLFQLQFHSPSEEAVKGQLSDMEVQLLHKDAQGKMLILSVRMREGNDNLVLASLWPNLPAKANQTSEASDSVNPAGLLPKERGYWQYQGSLTTPPCTEGIRWIVFKEESELSRDQLQTFQRIYNRNARPLQPPHDRKIEATK